MFREHLMEEVFERHNLHAALKQVRANKGSPGVDGMSVDELPDFLKVHWPEIKDQLFDGTYEPQMIKRVEIPKPGSDEKRKLRIPCVIDRLMRSLRTTFTASISTALLHRSLHFAYGSR
jgi:RNA-directed DNA polymerase